MPGKSRKKGKYTPQVKKQSGVVGSTKSTSPETGAPVSAPAPIAKAPVAPPAAVKTGTAAESRATPAPRPGTPSAMIKAAAVRYSNVKKELLTIGVMAGVILIVLVVISMALA